MEDEVKTMFGLSVGCLVWIALAVLLVVGGVGFDVWYNENLAVPLANSERHVQTCNIQYLTTQKAKIENDLDAISDTDLEIVDPGYSGIVTQLKAQEKQDADDIYNALDASDCSRPQIVKDMPELQNFFTKFPSR